ncbi:MAG TPA: hypothetical protein VF179_30450 [Thermoanaerobaculia bacterium]|nr:hypothetical protein [Thermoanaerobaculia bacterium]
MVRLRAIYRLVEESFESEAGYELAAAELEKVVPVWEGLLQSAHSIHLLETETSLVESLYDWTEIVESLYSGLFRQLSSIRTNTRLTARLKALQQDMGEFPASTEETKKLESEVAAIGEELRGEYKLLVEGLRPGNKEVPRLLEKLVKDRREQLRLLPQRLRIWPRRIS